MRVDAHQHFWRYDAKALPWIDASMGALRRDYLPKDLEPQLRAAGFDGTIAVQAQTSVAETEWLLDLADAHSFIRGVVGWVDLTDPRVGETLERLARCRKLRGIRHVVQSEPDDRFLLRDDFRRGLEKLAPLGLAYDLLVVPRQLPAAVELVGRMPRQQFVLDHLGKPDIRGKVFEPWATHLRALARHENVVCKLSGLVTEADLEHWTAADLRPYLDTAFEAFGADRLLIGSDWPVCLLAGEYARVMEVVVERTRSAGVLGENAERVYALGRSAP